MKNRTYLNVAALIITTLPNATRLLSGELSHEPDQKIFSIVIKPEANNDLLAHQGEELIMPWEEKKRQIKEIIESNPFMIIDQLTSAQLAIYTIQHLDPDFMYYLKNKGLRMIDSYTFDYENDPFNVWVVPDSKIKEGTLSENEKQNYYQLIAIYNQEAEELNKKFTNN